MRICLWLFLTWLPPCEGRLVTITTSPITQWNPWGTTPAMSSHPGPVVKHALDTDPVPEPPPAEQKPQQHPTSNPTGHTRQCPGSASHTSTGKPSKNRGRKRSRAKSGKASSQQPPQQGNKKGAGPRAKPANKQQRTTPAQSRLLPQVTVMSYNIKGMAKKERDLEALCLRDSIHFVCLQEIKTKTGFLPELGSYLSVVRPSPCGQRGMAILYDPDFAGLVSEVSTDYANVQVIHVEASPQAFLLVNVYLPCVCPAQDAVAMTETVADITKKFPPDTIVVIAGDFNCDIARSRNYPPKTIRSALISSGYRSASMDPKGGHTYAMSGDSSKRSMIDFMRVKGPSNLGITMKTAEWISGLGRRQPDGSTRPPNERPATSDHKALTVTLSIQVKLKGVWVERLRMENLQKDPQPFLDALERAIRDREPIRSALLADGGEDAPAALWSSAIQCLDTAAREGIGVRRYLKHGAGVRPPQSVQQILKRQVEISQDFGAGGMSEGNYCMEMDKILIDVSAETRRYLDRLWYGSPGDPEATVAWEVYKASKRRKDLTPAAKSTATLRSTVAAHSAKFADNVPIQPGMEEWVNTVDGLAATLEGLDPDN